MTCCGPSGPTSWSEGGTYSPEEVVGHEIVSGYGGQVQVTGVVDGVSTTQIVQSLSQSLQDAA